MRAKNPLFVRYGRCTRIILQVNKFILPLKFPKTPPPSDANRQSVFADTQLSGLIDIKFLDIAPLPKITAVYMSQSFGADQGETGTLPIPKYPFGELPWHQ